MTDSKDYFEAREPLATPKVELLAYQLGELRGAISALFSMRYDQVQLRFGVERAMKIVESQQEIIPRV